MVNGDIGFMLIKKIKRAKALAFTKAVYGLKHVGQKSAIYRPLQVDNPKGISLGNGVTVFEHGWLMGTTDISNPGLIIDDGTTIGHLVHIIAMKHVYIGKEVLFADKIYVSDCTHVYTDINTPILHQNVEVIKEVYIGDGTWVGENVCICGAKIGRHCVIGANSVVVKDIPDYSVAVGCPAKVTKKYDFKTNRWIKQDVGNKVPD